MPYQLLTPTQQAPHIITAYPMFYGAYCPHAFWHTALPATRNRPVQEHIYGSCWNPQTNQWGAPKLKSLPHSIVALLLLNTNPSNMQCGLPHFACLQRPTNKEKIPEYLTNLLHFGQTYSDYLNPQQKTHLMEHLLTITHSSCETYQTLSTLWNYQRPLLQPPPVEFSGDQE